MTDQAEQPQPKDLDTGERMATTLRAVAQGIAHQVRREHETEEGARQTSVGRPVRGGVQSAPAQVPQR